MALKHKTHFDFISFQGLPIFFWFDYLPSLDFFLRFGFKLVGLLLGIRIRSSRLLEVITWMRVCLCDANCNLILQPNCNLV